MKHPVVLLVVMAIALLFVTGSMMNSACKTGPHAWCDPTRQGATQNQEANNLVGHASPRLRSSSQR
jgi:glycerol uptake facilitator-like aquaporin